MVLILKSEARNPKSETIPNVQNTNFKNKNAQSRIAGQVQNDKNSIPFTFGEKAATRRSGRDDKELQGATVKRQLGSVALSHGQTIRYSLDKLGTGPLRTGFGRGTGVPLVM